MGIDDKSGVRGDAIETWSRLDAMIAQAGQVRRRVRFIHDPDFFIGNRSRLGIRRRAGVSLFGSDLYAAGSTLDGRETIEALLAVLRLPDEDRKICRQE